MSFLDSIPADTKDPAYGKALLDAVSSGNYSMPWSTVTLPGSVVLHVSTDALKVEGVRVNVSATLQQQIADILGALLPTPKIADLVWAAREVGILPTPQPISSSTAAMKAHSARIDALIAAAGSAAGLTRTVGKDWVIANELLTHPGKACNYGWHFPGASFGGSKWGAAVTPPLRLIQDMGFFHDPTHIDYSQTCTLVRRDCTVNGVAMDLADVLRDASTASLVNHEGVLKVLRQPGVAVIACALPAASASANALAEPAGGLCPTPKPPSQMAAWWPWALAGVGVLGAATAPWWLPWLRRRLRA